MATHVRWMHGLGDGLGVGLGDGLGDVATFMAFHIFSIPTACAIVGHREFLVVQLGTPTPVLLPMALPAASRSALDIPPTNTLPLPVPDIVLLYDLPLPRFRREPSLLDTLVPQDSLEILLSYSYPLTHPQSAPPPAASAQQTPSLPRSVHPPRSFLCPSGAYAPPTTPQCCESVLPLETPPASPFQPPLLHIFRTETLASRTLLPNCSNTISVSCQPCSCLPSSVPCPLYRYLPNSPRLRTTPTRSGFRWRYRTNSRKYGSSSQTIDLYRF